MSWILAAVLIALGVYLSEIRFLGTEWLSRAGCVVVMLGIWSGIGIIIQERVLVTRMRWQRRNAKVKARAMVSSDDTATTMKEIDDAFERQLDELTQKLKFSLGLLEVSLLLTGTFLWGFGDLLVG